MKIIALEWNICTTRFYFNCIGISKSNLKNKKIKTLNINTHVLHSKKSWAVSNSISDAKMKDFIRSMSFMSEYFDDFNKKLELTIRYNLI